MKNPKSFFLIFLLALILTGLAMSALRRSPLSVFVLKGADNNYEAFYVELYFNQRDSEVVPLSMTAVQAKQAEAILQSKDEKALLSFSKEFGKSSIAIGIPTSEEGWPGYLGGGLHGFFRGDSMGSFDNLQPTDRLYLALSTQTPPPPPFGSSEIKVTDTTKPTVVPTYPAAETPLTPVVPLHTGAVRVEILNGCGIKGAADWVGRRIKGSGILVTGTDNADNFHYPKTIVRSATGSPVALEEALEQLGVPKDSVEEISNPPASVDVVIIVGKDFRKLRERTRGRAHH